MSVMARLNCRLKIGFTAINIPHLKFNSPYVVNSRKSRLWGLGFLRPLNVVNAMCKDGNLGGKIVNLRRIVGCATPAKNEQHSSSAKGFYHSAPLYAIAILSATIIYQ
jgi:hypothetical protein